MTPPIVFLGALAFLAACHAKVEENVQVRAENDSRQIEQRYNEISAQAGNDVNDAVAPLDAETANLINQANGNAADINVATNTQ